MIMVSLPITQILNYLLQTSMSALVIHATLTLSVTTLTEALRVCVTVASQESDLLVQVIIYISKGLLSYFPTPRDYHYSAKQK